MDLLVIASDGMSCSLRRLRRTAPPQTNGRQVPDRTGRPFPLLIGPGERVDDAWPLR